MRISEIAAIAALPLLAACAGLGISGSAPNQTTVTAGGQRVTILAPAGFCIDRSSTSVTSAGAFVLVSDCQLLSPSRATDPTGVGAAANVAQGEREPIGAALTASLSPTGLGEAGPATNSLSDLARYARTPEGLAMIGRGGRSQGVRLLESAERDGVLYLHVEDRGPGPIPGLEPRYWRAFFEVNGRLTAVSQLGFAGSGIDRQSGLNLVSAFVQAIRAANPAPAG